MMEVRICRAADPQGRAEWAEAWRALPPERRDVYFRPEFVHAAELEGRGEGLCAVVRSCDRVWLYGFIMRRIDPTLTGEGVEHFDIETPYGYGGPIANCDSQDFLDEVSEIFASWAQSAGVIADFVRFHPLVDNVRHAPAGMRIVSNRSTVYIDTKAYAEDLWRSPFYRVQRHMVRKAEREGFSFDVAVPLDDISWFASMYAETHDRLGGTAETQFGPAYFQTLCDGFGGDAWIALVRKGREIVAAVLMLQSERTAHCHLMAYRREELTHGITNLVYHGIFGEAAQRGIDLVHMGGGRSTAPTDSLLKFKRSLGPLTATFSIGTLCRDHAAYESIGAAWEARFGPRPQNFFMFYRLQNVQLPV